MFKTFAFSLIAAFYLFSAGSAFAKPEPRTHLSAIRITADQTVEFTLSIEWPREEGPYTFALPVIPLKNLVTDRQGESQETFRKDGKDWTVKSFITALKPLGKGEGIIEDFVLPYVNTSNQEKGELIIKSSRVEITAAPIKLNPVWFSTTVFAAMAILVSIFLITKRKRQSRKTLDVERTPEDRAVDTILKELQSDDFARKDVKSRLHEMSLFFRSFLLNIYRFQASNFSEHEILAELKKREISPDEWKIINRLITKLNEAKYMGQTLNDSDFSQIKREIENFAAGKRIAASSLSSSPA